jgi:MraZ protein
METWEQNSQRIAEAAINAEQRRRIERRFFAMAFEIELDGQGRVVIPAKFRHYAGLNGEATVLGARDRIEVWNTERWEAYTAEMRDDELVGLPLPF